MHIPRRSANRGRLQCHKVLPRSPGPCITSATPIRCEVGIGFARSIASLTPPNCIHQTGSSVHETFHSLSFILSEGRSVNRPFSIFAFLLGRKQAEILHLYRVVPVMLIAALYFRDSRTMHLLLVDPVVLSRLPALDLGLLEPESNLLLGGLDSVRAVADVAADIL